MNTIQIISLIMAFLLLDSIVEFKLQYDLTHTVKHKKEWFVMAAFGVISSFLFTYATGVPFFIKFIIVWIDSAAMCMGYIWVFFSGRYGLKKGFDFWYTGTPNNPNKASTDKFLEKFSKKKQIAIKLSALLIPITIYIIILIS